MEKLEQDKNAQIYRKKVRSMVRRATRKSQGAGRSIPKKPAALN